jgi:subtilase family serine protease
MALHVNTCAAMRNGAAVFFATLGMSLVTGCVLGSEPNDDFNDAGSNPADFNNVPSVPVVAPCQGGSLVCHALVQAESGNIKPATTPQGYGPADLKSAYHTKTSTVTTTVAVVDAYNYPAAESDLAAYRSQFGLPACTTANGCLKIVNQSGAASPLPGAAPAGDDWTVEAALDLQMVSAACPTCKIVLVEAQDDQSDGLYLANDGAVVAGAAVVSNSWGGVEDGSEPTLETHFTHTGVGYFASTGDSGYDNGGQGPQYPATSAHVTAVGGTTLVKASNTRGWSEKAWTDGGANCSSSIPLPSWQPAISACANRYNSDLAANADPNTGVAVFNAANGGWIVVGGTSASSPYVAASMAVYGFGAQGPQFGYEKAVDGANKDFYDVHLGKDGTCGNILCDAAIGWDGPTGWGTPDGYHL